MYSSFWTWKLYVMRWKYTFFTTYSNLSDIEPIQTLPITYSFVSIFHITQEEKAHSSFFNVFSFINISTQVEVPYMCKLQIHYQLKGALDKCNIIPNFFQKKVGIFIPLEVLAWVMTACWVLRSTLIYFWRNGNISVIFYFSKSTSVNTQYSGTLWRWCCSQNTS